MIFVSGGEGTDGLPLHVNTGAVLLDDAGPVESERIVISPAHAQFKVRHHRSRQQ